MASAGAQSSVITVNTNTGAKETTLKDINVVGKNYYGTISVYGAAKTSYKTMKMFTIKVRK